MPELPEIETIRDGLAPHVEAATLTAATVRCRRFRYPVASNLSSLIAGKTVSQLGRRSKYLLFHFSQGGGLLCHLGMSGSLQLVPCDTPVKKHDHIDLHFDNILLRFHDPRRFGLLLVVPSFDNHPLLKSLGPEPLTRQFSSHAFYQQLQSQKSAIKQAIMNAKNVVGVGNIYANEALFAAKIHPLTPACQLPLNHVQTLVTAIKYTLRRAIRAGGSSLKDFVDSSGKPGYFQQQLSVYRRHGLPCPHCSCPIESIRLGQRSTFFCPTCQRPPHCKTKG